MPICPDTNSLDLQNRDPNNLNDHIRVAFEDCIGEPDGAHSSDCIYKCAFTCFEGGKNLCYMILTFLCAIPMALCWGCEFACVAFQHIWTVTPYLRFVELNCGFARKLITIFLECMCAPICETCGLVFSKIVVTNTSG